MNRPTHWSYVKNSFSCLQADHGFNSVIESSFLFLFFVPFFCSFFVVLHRSNEIYKILGPQVSGWGKWYIPGWKRTTTKKEHSQDRQVMICLLDHVFSSYKCSWLREFRLCQKTPLLFVSLYPRYFFFVWNLLLHWRRNQILAAWPEWILYLPFPQAR